MGILDSMVAAGLGVVVGVGQTYGLRELVDKKYPDKKIEQLKGFGTPSTLAGVSTGAVATGYTVHRAYSKRTLKDEEWFGFGYGISALATAIVSGLNPVETPAPGVGAGARGAVRKIILSGGRVAATPQGHAPLTEATQRGMVV